MKHLTLIAMALILTLSGCGKSEGEASEGSEAAAEQAPPFDCPTFEKRVYECKAEFTLAYGGTKLADIVKGNTPEEKAKAIQNALDIQKRIKQSPCKAHAWGDLANKDPKWQIRYNKCKADAPCAEWGKCVGEALGKPMTY
tara:strand:+ start:259 stop:681 length:423 start_codon:yes stop_codon:yes gene_type:complete